MNYTKGEWRVIGGKGEYSVISVDEQITLANVYGKDKANAQLIASAPDLYEALKAIMTERYDTWSPMYKQAKQALAKVDNPSAL